MSVPHQACSDTKQTDSKTQNEHALVTFVLLRTNGSVSKLIKGGKSKFRFIGMSYCIFPLLRIEQTVFFIMHVYINTLWHTCNCHLCPIFHPKRFAFQLKRSSLASFSKGVDTGRQLDRNSSIFDGQPLAQLDYCMLL